jgi:hypothetical protein
MGGGYVVARFIGIYIYISGSGSKTAAFASIPSTNSGPLEHLRAEDLLSVQIQIFGGLGNI